MVIGKKDLGTLIDAPIDTRRKLICEGRVTAKHNPTQVTYRLPQSQVLWLQRRVSGNINYAITKILAKAISDLNGKMGRGDFDIDDY